VIVGSFVVAYRAPVASFRRRGGVRVLRHYFAIDSFGVRPSLLFERNPRQADLKLCLELLLGKIALDAVPFRALGIQDQNCRGPGCVEAMEPGRMFLDVSLYGEEIRLDKGRDAFIRVRFGFQPSTSSSSGSRAEVE